MFEDYDVVISSESIAERVRQLGSVITEAYRDKDLVLVGVLKGAVIFMVDLARCIDLPVQIDFMAVSSYGATTESSGIVRILKDLDLSIEGKHVLVVEDIVDSGLTLKYLLGNLRDRNPASLRVCALLNKTKERKAQVDISYVGFEIPDEWVVGYGLDAGELHRNLPFIGTIRKQETRGERQEERHERRQDAP